GYDVVLASSGAAALDLAAARPFDIVLSDVQMPDLDGIEVLRRLRRLTPDPTVILVTAYGTIETAIRALHEGAFDYVRKPFKLDEVRLCVARAMERRGLREAVKSGGAASTHPAGTGNGRARPIVGSHPGMVELIGHVKGAFTGAIERRPGLFLEANRGTVFLDEVGDMSLSMQAKLLRVLQEQEVKPVGGTDTVPVDLRVVAATHQDLEALVE